MMELLTFALVLALAYANGTNDVSKAIATLVGSGVTNYRAAILWGTVYPLFSEMVYNQKLTVGPPFFNRIAAPLFGTILLVMGIIPLIGWSGATGPRFFRKLALPFVIAVALANQRALATGDKLHLDAIDSTVRRDFPAAIASYQALLAQAPDARTIPWSASPDPSARGATADSAPDISVSAREAASLCSGTVVFAIRWRCSS